MSHTDENEIPSTRIEKHILIYPDKRSTCTAEHSYTIISKDTKLKNGDDGAIVWTVGTNGEGKFQIAETVSKACMGTEILKQKSKIVEHYKDSFNVVVMPEGDTLISGGIKLDAPDVGDG